MRTELARRAQSKSEDMKDKMLEAKDTIEMEKQNKLEISAGYFNLYILFPSPRFSFAVCQSCMSLGSAKRTKSALISVVLG